jgi:hypothetical protein
LADGDVVGSGRGERAGRAAVACRRSFLSVC